MNNLRKAALLGQICRRHISQSAVRSDRIANLKETQKAMGAEDGIPIYLKSGFKDKVLYQGTLLLTIIGLGMVGETLYSLSCPKKE